MPNFRYGPEESRKFHEAVDNNDMPGSRSPWRVNTAAQKAERDAGMRVAEENEARQKKAQEELQDSAVIAAVSPEIESAVPVQGHQTRPHTTGRRKEYSDKAALTADLLKACTKFWHENGKRTEPTLPEALVQLQLMEDKGARSISKRTLERLVSEHYGSWSAWRDIWRERREVL